MSLKASTGLRNKLLDTNPLKAILAAGFIKIYAGAAPSDADAAIGGGNTLLVTISVASGGTGLTFAAAAADGTILKNASEVWSGLNVASGVASFYRFVAAGDTAALSTVEARIQGTVGLAGTDMVLSNTTLTSGATQTIDYFAVNMPAME